MSAATTPGTLEGFWIDYQSNLLLLRYPPQILTNRRRSSTRSACLAPDPARNSLPISGITSFATPHPTSTDHQPSPPPAPRPRTTPRPSVPYCPVRQPTLATDLADRRPSRSDTTRLPVRPPAPLHHTQRVELLDTACHPLCSQAACGRRAPQRINGDRITTQVAQQPS